jgi:hypothetical protein
MRVFYAAAMAVGLIASSMASAEEFPPIGNRYDTIPEDAKAAVKALKKLEARTEIGVNFVDYNKAVSEIYPDLKVFIESPDSKDMPELRLVLANAIACHLKVRELWSAKVASDDPIRQYNASMTLITAQPWLWKVAGVNTSGASALIDSPKADLPQVQKSIADGVKKLTVEAAMKAAEEEDISLRRQSRAKETGVAVPAPVPEEKKRDLISLLFQKGDYPEALSCGDLSRSLPPVYDKVPPASQEGETRLMAQGSPAGRIAVLLYDDVETAKKAFRVLVQGFGQGRKRVPSLGNIAERSDKSLAFRRNTAVVNLYADFTPFDSIVEGLRKADARLAQIAGEGDVEAPSDGEPAATDGRTENDDIIGKLFQDGDFGPDVTALQVSDDVPPVFASLPPCGKKGSVTLSHDGKQSGFVAGFIYDDAKTAQAAFESIAKGLGQGAAKVPNVGDIAAAKAIPVAGVSDLVFRRTNTVVGLRCPVKNVDTIARYARKIDGRMNGAAEPAKAPMPDVFDIRELRKTAETLVDEGGDKARFAKILLSLSATKTWQKRDEDAPLTGTLIAVSARDAVFATDNGEVTVRIQDIAGDSGAKIVRIKEMCHKLQP